MGSFREDMRFSGKAEDIEVGLVYFGARYYSPQLGRFISPDPLTVHGMGSDLNPYAYVAGRVSSIRKLKEIPSATHPSAKLERRPRRAEQPREGDATPIVDDLMAALDAEAAEEDGAVAVAAREDEG